MFTDRLEIRPLIDEDQDWFVEMVGNEDFMKGDRPRHGDEAIEWFRQLMRRSTTNSTTNGPYAEQALIKKGTSFIVGYAGAARWNDPWHPGIPSFEFTYRIADSERRRKYAEEACRALLDLWRESDDGEMFVRIDEDNTPSMELALKLGFVLVTPAREERVEDNRRFTYRFEASGT